MAILKCDNPSCKCDYQDQKYGKNMRVHNKMKNEGHRCATCLKERTGGGDKKK